MSWADPRTWSAAELVTAAKMNEIRDSLRASGGTYSTNVPSSPNDQDQFTYPADSTNGVSWEFKYASGSASTYKWQFVGGAPMFAAVATDETRSGSTAYGDLATTGPSITLPRAGDYEVDWGATIYADQNEIPRVAVKRGVTATSDNDAASAGNINGSAVVAPGISVARSIVMTGMSASDVVKLEYRCSAGTVNFQMRWLKIRPVRII